MKINTFGYVVSISLKTILSLKMILAIILLNPSQSFSCTSAQDSCDYYMCKEQELKCGDKGYLINFGYRYCSKFLFSQIRMSPVGIIWAENVRDCLQSEMELRRDVTCQNVKGIAYETHEICYIRYRFCDLPFIDKFLIGKIAAPSVLDPDIYPSTKKIMNCDGDIL